MLIGLDAIPLTEPKTGVGHYTYELARALAAARPSDDFELSYPSHYPTVELAPDGSHTPPPNLRAGCVGVGFFGRRWWTVGLPRHIRRRGFDLFHGTNYDVPLRARCPAVLTVHDLSAFLQRSTLVPRRGFRLRRRLPLMARAATMIITPTECVRREACEILRIDPAKVIAVHEAPREVFRPATREETAAALARLGVEGEFVLAVGTIEPRKNLLTLVRAFEQLAGAGGETGAATPGARGAGTAARATLDRLTLVVAGGAGWMSGGLFEHLSRSPARERVRFTGYVGDAELRALYSSCAAFVYPSLYEGFGLPPLEAMACGAPVVASRIGAHLEVLGEDAALLVPPEDARALALAVARIVTDEGERRRLSEAGRRHAARFSWARAARETLEVYDEALRRARRG
jgi:alpha-1,3-rhamnosyl/mannosyltransferase